MKQPLAACDESVNRCFYLALLLLLVTISGCGNHSVSGEPRRESSDGSSIEQTAERSKSTERDATYGSVELLRQAVEAAGHQCTDWSIRPEATKAAEMADCDYTTVLMIYATEFDKQANLDLFAQTGGTLLVGPNWIINGNPETLDEIAPELGGTRWTRAGPAN